MAHIKFIAQTRPLLLLNTRLPWLQEVSLRQWFAKGQWLFSSKGYEGNEQTNDEDRFY